MSYPSQRISSRILLRTSSSSNDLTVTDLSTLDIRHLPGAHNQKAHGGKGGGTSTKDSVATKADGDYKPGNWQEQPTHLWATDSPMGSGGVIPKYYARNGNALYMEVQEVDPAQRKKILGKLDELYQKYPPAPDSPRTIIMVETLPPGTVAMGVKGRPVMMFDAKQARTAGADQAPGHFMESLGTGRRSDGTEYAMAHEWGHVTDQKDKAYRDEQLKRIGKDLSGYGHSNGFEARAEAFADWDMTGGQSTNPSTQAYAKEEGWTS